jgi:hypothetical protein
MTSECRTAWYRVVAQQHDPVYGISHHEPVEVRCRDDRIIYVERPWVMSVLCFGVALVALYIGSETTPNPKDPPGSQFVIGGGFFLCALVLQFQSRAFIIDPDQRLLIRLERRLLRPMLRREYPLQEVQISVSTGEYSGPFADRTIRTWIWIEVRGFPRILFEGNIEDRSRVQELVHGLTQDLREGATLPPTE